MAWYPGAVKMELQPESDAQPAIRPTQFIVHSVVAPWDEKRIYAYWRDSTNLESHFGLDYDGSLGQYIGTETRADANAGANRRPDGTGAVSIETASNTSASDAWTPEQIEELIRLGVWLHERHGIPLRICRSHTDPGFGYHSMFREWSTSGTACPGAARIKQFREVVFPGIVARATGHTSSEEDDVTFTKGDLKTLANTDGVFRAPKDAANYSPDPDSPDHYWAFGTHTIDQTTRIRRIDRAVAELVAQGAARDAVLARLAEGGGLTAAEAQAAAEAGAQAALNKLAHALQED
ncbi:N-acetylmuramoyl-L-alanine amidase [Streptomyces sp. CC219B]|uniref:peptidoglycan recognition protein family protein n=1 Tax=Streptomyces sp. CC219B TaxID=3044574 RepID=UPI0024A96C9E|nr:N-acetylmuramoyl-L-alanine amidase [Streptomyces sp. CC219B]